MIAGVDVAICGSYARARDLPNGDTLTISMSDKGRCSTKRAAIVHPRRVPHLDQYSGSHGNRAALIVIS